MCISSQLLINTHFSNHTNVSKTPKIAYATYCTNSFYEQGSRVVLYSAMKTSSRNISAILLHTHKLNLKWKFPVITKHVIVPRKRNGYYENVLTKLLVFQLPYDRIVYIESDAIVLRSIEHLFDLPLHDLYVPHCRWCSPGYVTTTLMVVSPSQRIWDRLSIWVNKYDQKALYDMDIINEELREDIHHLPSVYGMLNSEFENKQPTPFYGSTFDEILQSAFFIHFTAVGKPWTVSLDNVRFRIKNGKAQHQMLQLYEKWHNLSRESYAMF